MNIDNLSIVLDAGPHRRQETPVQIILPADPLIGVWELFDEDGRILPLQPGEGATAWFMAPQLRARERREYRVRNAKECVGRARVEDDEEYAFDFTLDGEPVTSYIYGDVPARPYFFPLIGPHDAQLTRRYPMADYPGESRDHPHHRSLWIAHGDVNGVDNWSEEAGHGYTTHRSSLAEESADVFARLLTDSVWTDHNDTAILDQTLAVRLWATSGADRLLDISVELAANYGNVRFGDTKEGGILSARVASEIDVPRGGRIENSYGGIDEGETWGRPAHWCDYSGTIGGNSTGIAIMDHPLSFRSPTHWHVRNYGLMTANPFGYAAYTEGQKEGSHLLKSGDSLAFYYRVVLHGGDAAEADIRGRYLDFVSPPKATVRGID